jgi:hypothetical protein
MISDVLRFALIAVLGAVSATATGAELVPFRQFRRHVSAKPLGIIEAERERNWNKVNDTWQAKSVNFKGRI